MKDQTLSYMIIEQKNSTKHIDVFSGWPRNSTVTYITYSHRDCSSNKNLLLAKNTLNSSQSITCISTISIISPTYNASIPSHCCEGTSISGIFLLKKNNSMHDSLVVEPTHSEKYARQNGNLPQVGVNIKNI